MSSAPNSSNDKKALMVSDDELRILRDMAKYWRRHNKLEGPQGFQPPIPDTFQGAILAMVSSEDGIPAAESKLLPGRGKIRMRRLWFKDGLTTSEDKEIVGPDDYPVLFNNLLDEHVEHNCFNMSTEQEWVENDIVLVLPLKDGHFIVIPSVGSGGNLHATIQSCLGGGFYTAILSLDENRTWSLPSVGSGSGSVSGCDLCDSLTGTGGECATFTEPSRQSVPEDGATVYVYDPRKLILESGAHVVITDTGDMIATGEVVEYTGTGSGEDSAEMAKLYFVLAGTYRLVAIPDRYYECCGGTSVVLVRCDMFIVEGTACPGEQIECPVTGTGG